MLRYITIIFLLLLKFCAFTQPISWSSRGIGGGGALFSPSINPGDNDEFFIASDLSALFHTTDYGLNYHLVHFTELQAGHNSKVCFTNIQGLQYSVNYANDRVLPVKSMDGGKTWNELPGNPDNTETVFSIWADYHNPSHVVIAYYGQIYFSKNGGDAFTLVHTAMSNGAGCLVGGAFFDGDKIYLGTNDGVIITIDGGSTWTTANISGLPVNERIASFTAARFGNNVRFFCLTSDVGNVYAGLPGSDYWGFLKGVYSCDFSISNVWTQKMNGINPDDDYPMFLDMAENDIQTVYLAGSNSSGTPIILKSTNGGENWFHSFHSTNNQNINTGWSGHGGDRGWSYGECPFGFDVAANDPDRIIFGDYGFVHKSSNGGQSWQQAYVDAAEQHPANQPTPPKAPYHSIGMENTSCWQILWADANTIFAGFSDIKGIISTDSGESWSFNYSGLNANTTYRIARSWNGTLFAATSNIHDMYQSTRLADNPLDNIDAEGKILYSVDNGLTWKLVKSFGHPVFWIALDPNNPGRAYASVIHYAGGAGVGGIYRCDNLESLGSSSWTLLPDPPRTQKHPASITVLDDGKVLAGYSGRRNSNGAFTNSSGAFLYDPVLNNWQDVSDQGMYYWTKDIVVDPNDPTQQVWYACVFSGWGGAPNGLGGLYRTKDRGQHWTRISGTKFDRVTSITFNPGLYDQVYLTTEQQGLWISNNISDDTPSFELVESYDFRQPERVFFNPFDLKELWVSSFGNGMKVGSLNISSSEDLSSQNSFNIYPNPAKNQICVETEKAGKLTLYDESGRQCKSMDLHAGINYLSVSDLPSGAYQATLNGNTTLLIKE
ncbi:MAG: T9SS type A sorting domain-containing protein [Saprospiraceae bacterium]|nr:T9SS type A sorting domain-containing protein [Saprospiraceae bacterium]